MAKTSTQDSTSNWREERAQVTKDMGSGERSVRRYLDELEKANLLEVVQRGLGKTNLYRLHVVVQKKKS